MRRRGFLQALLGTAAIPAAIKAAEAVESIPELPVAAPAPEPQQMQAVAYDGYSYSATAGVGGWFTATSYVSPKLRNR